MLEKKSNKRLGKEDKRIEKKEDPEEGRKTRKVDLASCSSCCYGIWIISDIVLPHTV